MAIKVGDEPVKQTVEKVSLASAPFAFDKAAVLANTSEVIVPSGEAGYDFDPYDSPGEHAEGMFVGEIVNRFVSDPSGFCSTYREWHIMLRGAYAGFRGKTFGDVPKCPPLWQDEAQYFEGAAMVFNVIKCQWPTVTVAVGAFITANYTNVIPAALKLIGMG